MAPPDLSNGQIFIAMLAFFLVMECQCFLGYKERRGSTAENCEVKVNFIFFG